MYFRGKGCNKKTIFNMKKVFSVWSLTMLVVMFVWFSSCNENGIDEIDEKVTVGMKAGGELVGIETPLSGVRAGSDEKPLWGIQVFLASSGEFNAYSAERVAHGVFDNLSKVSLTLSSNKKYSIEVTYMPNGQNVIHYYGPTNDYWEVPFNSYGWTATPLNQIIYSKGDFLYALGLGMNTPPGDGNSRIKATHNEVDRYYGFVAEYIPVPNGTIIVDMKRTVFGLTFNAKKVDGFTFGSLLIKLDADKSLSQLPKEYTMTINNSQPTTQFVIPIICLEGVRASAIDPNYIETIKVSIGTPEKPDAIFYGDIKVKRKTMHIYNFNMQPNDESDGISVNPNMDDGGMDDKTENLN